MFYITPTPVVVDFRHNNVADNVFLIGERRFKWKYYEIMSVINSSGSGERVKLSQGTLGY